MYQKALDFIYNTAYETGLRLSETVKQANYTYLIFLRYYGCRSCQVDLIDLTQAYDRFRAKDAQILVVLQSSPEITRENMETGGVPFTIICDPDQKLYPLYEVAAAADKEGCTVNMTQEDAEAFQAKLQRAVEMGLEHGAYEGNEYQLPAYFLLDRNMQLLKEHRAVHAGDMPDVTGYLALLDS